MLSGRFLLSALAIAALAGPGAARPGAGRVEVVLLTSAPGAAEARVLAVRPGEPTGRELGRFAIQPDGAFRGALAGDTVVCVAEVDAARERSWTAHLIGVQGGTARTLATGLYAGSWPVPDGPGRVLVTRGQPGPVTGRFETRVDPIEIDDVDLATGALRPVLRWQGYLALALGRAAGAVVIYRIGPGGADLVTVDPAGQLRVVGALYPMARDFSLDARAGALVYQDRDGDAWAVERMELATGQRRQLLRAPHYGIAPALLPGGELVANPRPGSGLTLVAPGARAFTPAPAGRGLDELGAATPDGLDLAFLHRGDDGVPEPWLLDVATDHATRLPAAGVLAIVGVRTLP